ncbi:MAG: oligosaccharide flippase family protein [Pseudobutyrivibrio sp.]|uniref:oligosaccharide flippase family protein n=1 Tax=Pseudobutyrivibrio sp. TaxID=2014367 RepID=UPI001B238274|nr:oligosaccharide flippase family protein [Pseudobutyrivibrio sp.]MBO5618008.1 oligosaccharide flippase family protein [Pseudobutyrivibrio sp.]MBO6284198.1 oligosaccharide flippase family protein [Pseudobutyrivibrio sp.]MBP3262366.1 oligosaccharide flippase family protein [Pseudobutyrivibrio sp.]
MKILTKLLDKIKSADFILVTLSTVACSAMSFIFSVYNKRIVATHPLGIYSTCLLAQTYMNYAQFGVLNAYNRDYPQALGRKDYDEANRLKNTAMTFMLLVYGVVFVVFELWVAIYYGGKIGTDVDSAQYAFGYMLCPIMILLKSFDDMSNSTVRMNGHYNKSAIIGFIRTILALIIGVIAINVAGYYGLYAMTFASAALGIIMFRREAFKGARLTFDWSFMKVMIIGGLPLLINSLIWTIVQSVDKFVILGFLSTDDLGVYSVPLMGFTTMVLVPQTISQVFYIKISHLYGANHDETELLDKAAYFSRVTSFISGGACLFVYFVMPIFVHFFMPMYTEGTAATQILVIGVAIYATTMLYGNIFSVLKLNKSLIANSVALCIFNAIFSSGLVLFVEPSINMVAIGTGLSYALYSLLLVIKLSKRFKFSFTKLLVNSWGPAVGIIIPGLLIYRLVF